jgi:hypothetical protein
MYLWIKATPNSNVFRIIEVGIKILKNIEGEIKQINELKRCINK